jgi:hypothetical protein
MKYQVGTEFHTVYVSPPDEGAPMYGVINKIFELPKPHYELTWVYSHNKQNFTTSYSDKDLGEILKGWRMDSTLVIKTYHHFEEDLFTI